jgi:hypothetical protein
MRRRALLKGAGAGAGAIALSSIGVTSVAADEEAGYAPLGAVSVSKAAEAVVGADGETAYVAAGDGFATVDLSDPANPEILANVEGIAADKDGGPMQNIMDVKVSGDRLLVTGPARRGPISGFVVYDVSDPANPTQATDFYRTGYRIHNADFDGEYAYITDSESPARSPMAVFDVSGQTTEEVSRWSPLDEEIDGVEGWSDQRRIPGVLHDLNLHDDVLYCSYWDAGTWMVDVSDPENPSYVNYVCDYDLEKLMQLPQESPREFQTMYGEGPGNDHYAAVSEDSSLLVVGGEAWDNLDTGGGGPAGIDLWDISDPQSPEKLSTIAPENAPDLTKAQGTWTTAHNFDIRDGKLYSSWYDAGVKIHDISDPENPERIAWWRKPDEARFWTAESGGSGEFFVASSAPKDGHRGALYVFPDEAGQQENPPEPLASHSPYTRESEPSIDLGTTTGTGTTTETSVATTTEDGGGQGMPGFGIGAAVAGLGLGAYRFLGGDDEE